MTSQFGDYQNFIYAAGLEGKLPQFPMDWKTLEEKATTSFPYWVLSYVAGGCGNERTQNANVEAFGKYGIVPRRFVKNDNRDLSVRLWDTEYIAPVFLAPIGVIGICSADFHGDIHIAEASAQTGIPMMASTLAQDPMEEVIPYAGATPGMFQLYTPHDRELAVSLIKRAQNCGYKAIAVTLDTWVTGWRPRDLNLANFPQLRGLCLANYTSDPVFLSRLEPGTPIPSPQATWKWAETWKYSLSWEDLTWLREEIDIPLIVKGICHPDDARRAIDMGVDGIYCSNHGGRQSNSGLPALQLLPEVVKASGDVPVFFDSGIRSGSDIAIALAMGASMVGIARPFAYALAHGGTAGVVNLIRTFLAELDLLMAIDGFPTVKDLQKAEVHTVI